MRQQGTSICCDQSVKVTLFGTPSCSPGCLESDHSEPREQDHPGQGSLLPDEKSTGWADGGGEPCGSRQQAWLGLGVGNVMLPILALWRVAGQLEMCPSFSFLSLRVCGGATGKSVHLESTCKSHQGYSLASNNSLAFSDALQTSLSMRITLNYKLGKNYRCITTRHVFNPLTSGKRY